MSRVCFWLVLSDLGLAARWGEWLKREGWELAEASDLPELRAQAWAGRVGLALVDWELLKPSPAEALKGWREAASGISMILGSSVGLGSDKIIAALEAGADDHIPFSIDRRLLLAKLKAHLRRLLPSLAAAKELLRSPGGELRLDRSRRQAWVRRRGDWAAVDGLTPTEFDFLVLFLQRPGTVLERRFIVEAVWRGDGDPVHLGTVDKHVESLRRKLGRFGALIRTVYGVGYALREGL